ARRGGSSAGRQRRRDLARALRLAAVGVEPGGRATCTRPRAERRAGPRGGTTADDYARARRHAVEHRRRRRRAQRRRPGRALPGRAPRRVAARPRGARARAAAARARVAGPGGARHAPRHAPAARERLPSHRPRGRHGLPRGDRERGARPAPGGRYRPLAAVRVCTGGAGMSEPREGSRESSLRVRELESLRAELERRVGDLSPPRWNADPEDVQRSVARLVLTLVEFLRQLMERQAIRRMDAGTLTPTETEDPGQPL